MMISFKLYNIDILIRMLILYKYKYKCRRIYILSMKVIAIEDIYQEILDGKGNDSLRILGKKIWIISSPAE